MLEKLKNITMGNISFILFSVLSFFISLSMYIQLGANNLEKLFFVCITIGIELWKINSVLKIEKNKTELIDNQSNDWKIKVKQLWKKSKAYFIYFVLAFLSIFAGYGYSLTATEHKLNQTINVTESIDSEIESINKEILRLEDTLLLNKVQIQTNLVTIEKNEVEISRLPDIGYNPTKLKLQDINKNLREDNKELVAKNEEIGLLIENKNKEIREINKQKESQVVIETSARSMFAIIADASPIETTEKQVRYLMLILLAIVIEVGIYSNSSSFSFEKKEEIPKKKIVKKKQKQEDSSQAENSLLEQPELPIEENFLSEQPVLPIEEPVEENFLGVQDFNTVKIPKQEVSNKVEIKIKRDKTLFKKFVKSLFEQMDLENSEFFIDKKELSSKIGVSIERVNDFYDELKDMKAISYVESADVWIPNFEMEKILKLIDAGA